MRKLLACGVLAASLAFAPSVMQEARAEAGAVRALCNVQGMPTILLQAFPFTGQATWGVAGEPDYLQSAPYRLEGPNILAIFPPSETGEYFGFGVNTVTGRGVIAKFDAAGSSQPMPLYCRLVR